MSVAPTATVKRKAFELGADLASIGSVERPANFPPRMSPAGLVPSARSVLVLALHHGDGCATANTEDAGIRADRLA
jgi:hypothetical protein